MFLGSMLRFNRMILDVVFGLISGVVSSCLIFINVVIHVRGLLGYIRMVNCVKNQPNVTLQGPWYRYTGECIDTLRHYCPGVSIHPLGVSIPLCATRKIVLEIYPVYRYTL